MNSILSNVNKWVFSIGLLVGTLCTLTSCKPPPPPPEGNANEALTGRNAMIQGQTIAQVLTDELANAINNLGQLHPSTALIIREPSTDSLPLLSSTQLATHLGVHEETSLGVFTHTPGGTNITVRYSNGVEVIVRSIQYDAANNLSGYNLRASSDNTITTPLSQRVNINLTYAQTNLNFTIGNVPAPTLLRTSGWVHYTRALISPVKFEVTRWLGAGSNANQTVVSTENYSLIRDVTNGTADAPFWRTSEVIWYEQPPASNLWVGRSASQLYKDNTITRTTDLFAASLAEVSTTGLVSYAGSGDIMYNTANGPVRIAHITGGPYTCNTGQPTAAGNGPVVTTLYNDGNSQVVFPSPEFTCARVVVQ